MVKDFENSAEANEGTLLAQRLEELLGEESTLRPFANLIKALEAGGKQQAQLFCWNESDKLRSHPDLTAFLEREIFDAGEDRLGAETPWNIMRRMKAKPE